MALIPKNTTKTYTVGVIIKVWCNVNINASSYEDTLDQAKKLSVTDFVKFKGEYIDGNLLIAQIDREDVYHTDLEDE